MSAHSASTRVNKTPAVGGIGESWQAFLNFISVLFLFSTINKQTIKTGVNFDINLSHLLTENKGEGYLVQLWHG